jgi:Carotenoid biosynthesis protein
MNSPEQRLAVVVSWAFEKVGIATGLIYSPYHYSARLGVKLGAVPVIIPLAWFMMGLCELGGRPDLTGRGRSRVVVDDGGAGGHRRDGNDSVGYRYGSRQGACRRLNVGTRRRVLRRAYSQLRGLDCHHGERLRHVRTVL